MRSDHELVRGLANIPRLQAPARLTDQLLVIASKEASRQRRRVSWRSTLLYWRDRFSVLFDNAMRPFAIPTAGGFVAALLLFGTLAPSLMVRGVPLPGVPGDVPTGLYTGASIRSFVPIGSTDEEIDVELTIDGQGRLVDYSLPNGNHVKTPALRRAIESSLLFTQFYPATSFGQPTTGKVRLSLRNSRIDVKG